MYYCAPRRGPVSRDASPAQYYRPSTAGPVPGTSATIPPWAGHWDPGAGIADPAPSRRGGPAACRSVSCRSLSGTFGAVPRPAWNDAVARGLSLMNTPSPRPRHTLSRPRRRRGLMKTPSPRPRRVFGAEAHHLIFHLLLRHARQSPIMPLVQPPRPSDRNPVLVAAVERAPQGSYRAFQ